MDTSDAPQVEPHPIRQLPESLVNKIAAGEIIHRPASALKELLENSLDAGSTLIRVTVKDGGLKLLQIQDNGCGIKKEDLPLLCRRFATSKISSFDDLLSIGTYGFRGEALASMSHVAELSVLTKVKADGCAWKASYSDGSLVPSKPGQTADPKPSAGNDGTTITIANLFASFPTRLASFKSHSDEYGRILDVMTKYAVHNPRVSFVCKKVGAGSFDLSTTPFSPTGEMTNSERTKGTTQAIRALYGQTIARELLSAEVGGDVQARQTHEDDDDQPWSAEVYFTSVNMTAKKLLFFAFVNHRLVELPRLKKALESVYAALLPKGSAPGFVYASLLLPPKAVDVNVHPTKASVHFLNEEEILEKITDKVQAKLAERGSISRSFTVQTILPPANKETKTQKGRTSSSDSNEEDLQPEDAMDVDAPAVATVPKTYSHNKVRTSTKDRTLESMLKPSLSQAPSSQMKSTPTPAGKIAAFNEINESQCYLTSIRDLRQGIKESKHAGVTEILEGHTFVGVVDTGRCLSLIQHSTKLYLVNHAALAEELFYQLGLRQFGDMRRIKLSPSPPLRSLIEIAVENETIECSLSKSQIVERIVATLMDKKEMLTEYFSLRITPDGLVESVPLLLKDYTPNLDKLPYFLMRLGPQVDWTSEKECFESFLRELAYFYVPGPGPLSEEKSEAEDAGEEVKTEIWEIQHALFPALRKYLLAPRRMLEGDILQVADIPQLYKIFERC